VGLQEVWLICVNRAMLAFYRKRTLGADLELGFFSIGCITLLMQLVSLRGEGDSGGLYVRAIENSSAGDLVDPFNCTTRSSVVFHHRESGVSLADLVRAVSHCGGIAFGPKRATVCNLSSWLLSLVKNNPH